MCKGEEHGVPCSSQIIGSHVPVVDQWSACCLMVSIFPGSWNLWRWRCHLSSVYARVENMPSTIEQSLSSHKCFAVCSPEGGSSFPQVTRRMTCSMLALVSFLFQMDLLFFCLFRFVLLAPAAFVLRMPPDWQSSSQCLSCFFVSSDNKVNVLLEGDLWQCRVDVWCCSWLDNRERTEGLVKTVQRRCQQRL